MYSLLLYERLTHSATPPFIANITNRALKWRRSTRATGGFWLGSFQLSGEDCSREELIFWFNNYLGNHLEEKTYGTTSWEGLLYEMLLTLDGVQYRRTLDKEWWHNYVKVLYRDDGIQAATTWSQNTDSRGEYGRMEYIDTIGEATAAGATALRNTRLENFAWPRSRCAGGLKFGGQPRAGSVDTLRVTPAGYVATMNWRYRETSIMATAASTAVTTLVGASEFIAAGAIDSNALSVDVDCTTPQRLWDVTEDIILQGDAANNRWVGGVYEGRAFDYNAAATTVEHWMRGGQLFRGGTAVVPSSVRPDFIVHNANAPSGGVPIGGNVWDDPRNAWITEVEFIAPDGLILKPAGFEDVQVLKG